MKMDQEGKNSQTYKVQVSTSAFILSVSRKRVFLGCV